MLVEILDTDRRGRLLLKTYLCERHARELAAGEGSRWPEPHEHSAKTRHKDGEATHIRVFRDKAGECEQCASPSTEELNAVVHERRFDELTNWMLGPRPEEQ